MKIGFDISQVGKEKAGCGHYAESIIQALVRAGSDHEFLLYPHFGDFFFDPEMRWTKPVQAANVQYAPAFLSREEAARAWSTEHINERLGNVDLVHCNNFWSPPVRCRAKVIYTLYDLGFIEEPDWATETNRVGCFKGVFSAALFADWVVAISQSSRQQFLKIFPTFPSERVSVVYPYSRFEGVSNGGTRPAALGSVAEGKFWLSVGTIEPRKNQQRLVAAYAQYIQGGGEPMPLVLAGGPGWLMDGFVESLPMLTGLGRVIVTGYLADSELVWLYRNCFANIYVSLFEGFGLPVLEGMALGAPTIASASTSIPEITGADGVLVNPLDANELASAMLTLSRNRARREQLAEQGAIRSRIFSSKSSAGLLLDLYEEVVQAPKRIGARHSADTRHDPITVDA